MILSFSKYLRILFIAFLFFTLLDAYLSFQQLTTLRQGQQAVDRAEEVKLELQQFGMLLADAETGQRGYMLTGDISYLAPYNRSTPRLDKTIMHMNAILEDAPYAKKLVPKLMQLTHERIKLLSSGIAFRKEEGFDIAQVYPQEDTGKKLMDQIRSLIARMSSEEDKVLQLRNQVTKKGYRNVYATVGLAMVLDLALIFLAYYLVQREIIRRDEFEKRKDEFISTASHELRTPITSLKMFSQILRRHVEKYHDKEIEKFVDRIDNQAEKLTELIRDLLDVSRIQTGKLQVTKSAFDLQDLILETIDSVAQTSKKHKIITKGKITTEVYADRYRIYQVLVNLLTNAIKYSPKGGAITVTMLQKKKIAQVSIKDQGIGIAKEHLDKIFDRLYQINDPHVKQFAGLGIGLFVVAEIIKQHNGRIWVESKKGKGTTFTFSLPLTTSKTDTNNPSG